MFANTNSKQPHGDANEETENSPKKVISGVDIIADTNQSKPSSGMARDERAKVTAWQTMENGQEFMSAPKQSSLPRSWSQPYLLDAIFNHNKGIQSIYNEVETGLLHINFLRLPERVRK